MSFVDTQATTGTLDFTRRIPWEVFIVSALTALHFLTENKAAI